MSPEHPRADGTLSIGDVSERTGLSPATLRMWEVRHGFPTPKRLESGHRRFAGDDVEVILDVLRRRDSGVRLDVAIEQAVRAATSLAEPEAPSIYAEMRTRHPHLVPQRMHKSTLIALSWAIEDEFCANAERSYLFAAFQRDRFFAASERRWRELARVARRAFVFADFPDHDGADKSGRLVRIPLTDDAPLNREWAIVCDAPGMSVAMSAFELPGQEDRPDRERMFEAVWTLEPAAVRDAARAGARAAILATPEEAGPVLYDLAEEPTSPSIDPRAATAMFNRVVAYMDRLAHR
jgi:MerR family transcriptional regulator, light-induced transcriptional regulator